jgi:hypothetical protein
MDKITNQFMRSNLERFIDFIMNNNLQREGMDARETANAILNDGQGEVG